MLAGYDLADNPLNKIEWAFFAAECVHIASLALSIGTIELLRLSTWACWESASEIRVPQNFCVVQNP